ncbi:hypothetical protein [Mycoplana dimorpha]|uniref:Uncharacterized protein n=1 Tax=Mycoplana dimorpha TaxID=28320 RepID=A0A2T5B1L5_MYCDI|nr:hypothetical protein [Mycoplana dimorpha]PTM92862.1 hypothetical protein C7449_107276 [Mycoplana dimorpha]
MSQATNFGVPLSGPATPAMMAARIQENLDAFLTAHSGPSRPDYAVAGTIWLDTATAGRHRYYSFDGTTDHLLLSIDIATGVITYGPGLVAYGSAQELTEPEKALARANIGLADGWATQPIGVPIPLLDNLAGVAAPPKDKAYRYVRLSAGLTGAGGYNEGLLTAETVSGTAPLVEATAVINLAGSPINGRTIDLVNTSRRFLRAGSAGQVENDQMQVITGTLQRIASGYEGGPANNAGALDATNIANSNTLATGTNRINFTLNFNSANSPNARTGAETRSKNLGVTYYMRIL